MLFYGLNAISINCYINKIKNDDNKHLTCLAEIKNYCAVFRVRPRPYKE